MRRARANVSRRRCLEHRSRGAAHCLQAGWREAQRGDGGRLDPRPARGAHRPHCRREHPEQQDRRDGHPYLRDTRHRRAQRRRCVMPFFSRTRARAGRLEEFGFAELRGGGSRVVIVPALGGKIAQLEMGGRQWLWTSDVIPYGVPDEHASYVETADSGGYDECFPTVGPCKVPTWVRGFGGVQLPDHGELWSQAPTIDVRTSPNGQRATTTWTGRLMPYRLTREVRVAPGGEVDIEYEATNTGADRIPFIWSSHPLFPLTSATRIDLPAATRFHVYAQHEIAVGVGATDLRWPMARSSGRLLDLSNPAAVAKRYACKLFLEMREGRAALIEDGVRLEVSFRIDEVP